jgi:hypothetical protein
MSKPLRTIAGLRTIVPHAAKVVEAKILDHLDAQA